MLCSSSRIRRTPGLDRSYTISDGERIARIIPWSAGVEDPIGWFIDCPGSEVCDAFFQWRDPQMCLISKALIFGLLRRIKEKRDGLKRRRTIWLTSIFGLLLLLSLWRCLSKNATPHHPPPFDFDLRFAGVDLTQRSAI